jgi:6-phosphogluconolactonase
MELEKKLVSFSIESETFVKLSESSSFGDYPCFIGMDPEGKFILVANYGSGDLGVLASFSLDENGIIENTATITHYPFPGEKSHIHCAEIFRSNHGPAYAAVVDLGMNTVSQYLITPLVGISSDTTPTTVISFPSGSGPRQIKFHPILPIAIVILELANALVVLPLDRDTGLLKQPADSSSATICTLREGDDPTHMSSAEVVISPLSSGGRFVYASNRDCTAAMASHELGHTNRMYRSTVAVFKIISDGYESYKLQLLQHVSACGDFPRYIQLVRDGAELVLVNQIDSNFVSFLVDSTTGCIQEDSAVITTHENLRHPTHTLFL